MVGVWDLGQRDGGGGEEEEGGCWGVCVGDVVKRV